MVQTAPRFTTQKTDEGWYVFDTQDERLLGDPFEFEMAAEVAAQRMEKQGEAQRSLVARILKERDEQNARFGAGLHNQSPGTWLAILAKKVGDTGAALLSTSRKSRNVEQELIEVAAVALAWLEDLTTQKR